METNRLSKYEDDSLSIVHCQPLAEQLQCPVIRIRFEDSLEAEGCLYQHALLMNANTAISVWHTFLSINPVVPTDESGVYRMGDEGPSCDIEFENEIDSQLVSDLFRLTFSEFVAKYAIIRFLS